MPNLPLQSEYERIVKNSERLFKSLEKSSKREYALMLREVRAEVATAYAQYANADGVLTYAEMQKYNRIKKLKSAIDDIVQDRTGNVKALMSSVLKENISTSYAASILALGETAGVALPEKVSIETITAILKKPVGGWTYSERMALRTRDLVVKLQGTITNGFVRGDKLQAASLALKSTAEKSFVQFRSFAGDMTHEVSQDAIKESTIAAEDLGIHTTKTWVTAGDGDVREAHQLLDGQTVRGDEYFVIPSGKWKGYRADGPGGFGEPALDYKCRCWIVADVVYS
jgi:hypothetical protein